MLALDNMLEDLNIDRDAVDGYDVSKAYGEAYDMLAKRGLRSTKAPGAVRPGTVLSPADGIKKRISWNYKRDDRKYFKRY